MAIKTGYADIASTISELKALEPINRVHKMTLMVLSERDWFVFDAFSGEAEDGVFCYQPDLGTGRWYRMGSLLADTGTAAITDHANLTGVGYHIPPYGIANAQVDANANIAWNKISKVGANPSHVGAQPLNPSLSSIASLSGSGILQKEESGQWSFVTDLSSDAATFNGQSSSYYLARANHTGTQPIGSISGLESALDSKQPLSVDLTAITNLAGDGLLRRVSGVWSLIEDPGGDASTLNNESPSYYLARANHTGTQPITSVSGLQSALNDIASDLVNLQDDVNNRQLSDSDLTAIASLSGFGYLRRTGTSTWILDTGTTSAENYRGVWRADTNVPSITSGVGTVGDYYTVSIAGSTNIDGETNWQVGDQIAFNGSIWQRRPSPVTGGVSAVDGQTGSVDLSTSYQPLNVTLSDIASLSGDGLLRKEGATWSVVADPEGNAVSLGGELPSYYLDRTNHTGLQAIATIEGLQSAIDSKQDSNTNLTDIAVLVGDGLLKRVGSTWSFVTDPEGDAITLDGESPAYYLDRSSHTGLQPIATVDGLQSELDSKQPENTNLTDISVLTGDGILKRQSGTWVFIPDLEGDATTLDGELPVYYLDRSNHTGLQPIATVDGLQSELDQKSDTNHDHDGVYQPLTMLDPLVFTETQIDTVGQVTAARDGTKRQNLMFYLLVEDLQEGETLVVVPESTPFDPTSDPANAEWYPLGEPYEITEDELIDEKTTLSFAYKLPLTYVRLRISDGNFTIATLKVTTVIS